MAHGQEFTNLINFKEMEPALTTVHIPAQDIGRIAGEEIVKSVASDAPKITRVRCDVELVLRATTRNDGDTAHTVRLEQRDAVPFSLTAELRLPAIERLPALIRPHYQRRLNHAAGHGPTLEKFVPVFLDGDGAAAARVAQSIHECRLAHVGSSNYRDGRPRLSRDSLQLLRGVGLCLFGVLRGEDARDYARRAAPADGCIGDGCWQQP